MLTEKEEVGMVGTGSVEKLCSKDNGERAWIPATRSAMAVIGFPAVGKQSCIAAISRQDR